MKTSAWQNLGLATLIAATLASVVWLFTGWPPEASRNTAAVVKFTPEPTAPVEPAPPEAVFLGDSYTQGIGADDPADGFACETADAMGWTCVVNGQTGTGYVNDGRKYTGYEPGFSAYPQRVNDVIAERPDVVVVSGGRNDFDGWTVPQISAAASATIERLNAGLPARTDLVVVAPFWTDGEPFEDLLTLRDELRSIAEREDAVFIDPLGEEWITNGNADRLISDDGIHPNETGHQYLARRLAGALRESGVRTE